MFFLAFFWAFFNASLAPSIELGSVWPPQGIEALNPWEVPFLNTLLLLSSGASVTWAHHAILAGETKQATQSLILTLILAFLFTGLQGVEYLEAPFTISDSVYGSTFYLATGFHGFHVSIGVIFLFIFSYKVARGHLDDQTPGWFTKRGGNYEEIEILGLYWHFVDLVWVFSFAFFYLW